MNGYSMGFGSVYMFAVWVLVGFSTFAIIKIFFNQNDRDTKSDNDLDILKKRYAKGEIDSDEYRKIKNDLNED
ncbi:MAG: SHOCT domain-containing protein [Gammaproteobacteria bacterium]|nr:SHOCT domain-containing protein [Gammaproteobacteria bacterium]